MCVCVCVCVAGGSGIQIFGSVAFFYLRDRNNGIVAPRGMATVLLNRAESYQYIF